MKNQFAFLFVLAMTFGCQAIKDQAKSRELLAKCLFSIEKISVERIDFDDVIRIVNLAKDVDFRNPGVEVIPLLNEVRKLNFDLDFKTLDVGVTLAVDNPNDHKVMVDSVAFDAFLDGIKVANVLHDGRDVEIAPSSAGYINLIFGLPTSYKLKKVIDAEEVNLQGKVWLKLELIKGLPVTIPFRFDVSKPVPREEIQNLLDEQKSKIMVIILEELISSGAKDLLKKF